MFFKELEMHQQFQFQHEIDYVVEHSKTKEARLFKDNIYVKINDIEYRCINNLKIKRGFSYENTFVIAV